MITASTSRTTGKERDTETGLDYFGARYYGSTIGRFLSTDEFLGGPISVFGGRQLPGPLPYADISNPQSLNKYAYAYNSPLRYIDPDGHAPADLCAQQTNCTQKTDKNGNTTVQLTESKTKIVRNADGTTTVTRTTTTTTYTFNAAGNMTGGQQQVQVSNATFSQTGAVHWQTSTSTKTLGYSNAASQFGADNLGNFQNSFLDTRGMLVRTPGAIGRDIKNHPFRAIGRGIAIGFLTADPPTAPLGAALAVAGAAADLGESVQHANEEDNR